MPREDASKQYRSRIDKGYTSCDLSLEVLLAHMIALLKKSWSRISNQRPSQDVEASPD